LRVTSDGPLPKISRIEALTDSEWKQEAVRLEWQKAPAQPAKVETFNGLVERVEKASPRSFRLQLQVVSNPDPNTFDRTLITVREGKTVFTFAVDDLKQGALFLPKFGVAVLPESDKRDYATVAKEQKSRGTNSLYDRVAKMPEQTWRAAWAGIPRKKSDIYFPLGLDGGRQRFRLEPDGSIRFRSNDNFLKSRPGKDTPRLALEPPNIELHFGPSMRPVSRTIEEESIPICHTTWETNGVRISQTAFVTELAGAKADGSVPPADAFAVFLAEFVFTNSSQSPQEVRL